MFEPVQNEPSAARQTTRPELSRTAPNCTKVNFGGRRWVSAGPLASECKVLGPRLRGENGVGGGILVPAYLTPYPSRVPREGGDPDPFARQERETRLRGRGLAAGSVTDRAR